MRVRACVAAAVVTSASPAFGRGPPTMVHTKDGSVYYGELVERVVDDHVTILTASGEVKRFAIEDIDPTPAPDAPLYRPPQPEPPPTGTVRTKDGSEYWGEILERVPDDHVSLRLASGETKVLPWEQIDASRPPPAYSPARPPGPTETIYTTRGNVYHGELVEKIVGVRVVLVLATGETVTIPWRELGHRPAARARRPEPDDVVVEFKPVPATAHLERRFGDGWKSICAGACEELASPLRTYRVSGEGLVASDPFEIGSGNESHVSASLGSAGLRSAGYLLTIGSLPVIAAGIGLLFASASASRDSYGFAPPYYAQPNPVDNTGLDTATVIVNLVGPAMLAVGIWLLASSSTSVKVDGVTVGRLATGVVAF